MKPAIHYTVTPFDTKGHRFKVALTVLQDTPAGQLLSLPAWIPGSYMIRDFSKNIETINAHDDCGIITLKQQDKQTWRTERASTNLTVSIIVYAWDMSVRTAHLDDNHGFFNGTSLFLQVHGLESSPCLVTLNPPKEHKKWKVFTSLPEAPASLNGAKRHCFGRYLAPNYDSLIDHPIEMGTAISQTFFAHGHEHELVFTGYKPNLDINRITEDIKKICETQIAFFEPQSLEAPFADSTNRYVFLTHITDNGYGGLEHRSSTALICGRNDLPAKNQTSNQENYHNFLGLVSHEYFHTWNVKRIKPKAFVPYALSSETYTELLWIFEGFTSYYDDLLLWRAGCISSEDYLKRISKTITQVLRGPGRLKQSLAESSFSAWHKYYKQDENAINAIVSYYTKGSLMAFALDLKIRVESQQQKSLDDVMRYLWQEYGRNFYALPKPKGLTLERFITAIKKCTGLDLKDFITHYTEHTKDLPLQKLCQSNRLKLHTHPKSKPYFNFGWALQDTNNGVLVKQVMEGGNAHKAGLSAHDTIIAVSDLEIKSQKQLDQVLDSYDSGACCSVHYFRDGRLFSSHLTLSKNEELEYRLSLA